MACKSSVRVPWVTPDGMLLGGSVVQWGARRHGSDGIPGNDGNVESVTYRI